MSGYIRVYLFLTVLMMHAVPVYAGAAPGVVGGVIDISAMDEEIGVVSLGGEWRVYSGRLLSPDQFFDPKIAGQYTLVDISRMDAGRDLVDIEVPPSKESA